MHNIRLRYIKYTINPAAVAWYSGAGARLVLPVGIEVKPLSSSSSMKKQRLAKMMPERKTSITRRPSSLNIYTVIGLSVCRLRLQFVCRPVVKNDTKQIDQHARKNRYKILEWEKNFFVLI